MSESFLRESQSSSETCQSKALLRHVFSNISLFGVSSRKAIPR